MSVVRLFRMSSRISATEDLGDELANDFVVDEDLKNIFVGAG